MGTPLKTPPVYFTVAQVRFNAILKLREFLPGIQEELRKVGFPDYGEHQAVVLQLATQDGKVVPVPAVQERFAFGNVKKTHTFWLDSQSLTLQSTDYGRFEDFSAAFLRGLDIVHGVVRLDFTERVGLRYLDRVMPRQADALDQYLTPEVLGLSRRLRGNPLHSYSETLSEMDNIKMISRVVIQNGGLAFPPDLMPGDMAVPERFKAYKGPNAILDNDGFVENREEYSRETVSKLLHAIHDVIIGAFRVAASDYAFKVWNE